MDEMELLFIQERAMVKSKPKRFELRPSFKSK